MSFAPTSSGIRSDRPKSWKAPGGMASSSSSAVQVIVLTFSPSRATFALHPGTGSNEADSKPAGNWISTWRVEASSRSFGTRTSSRV